MTATERNNGKLFTATKKMVEIFAKEYGYKYTDNNKVVLIEGEGKKITIDIKKSRYTNEKTGYSDDYVCVSARLMMIFGKFNYN